MNDVTKKTVLNLVKEIKDNSQRIMGSLDEDFTKSDMLETISRNAVLIQDTANLLKQIIEGDVKK